MPRIPDKTERIGFYHKDDILFTARNYQELEYHARKVAESYCRDKNIDFDRIKIRSISAEEDGEVVFDVLYPSARYQGPILSFPVSRLWDRE